ncbi:MAG: membrane protein insertion efficiency factor YidD [Deltaproteobacteria bacterium]|nr:membrane protein insertion efficiency factor YidD [Deltaproteobacteria bacterium]
MGSSTQPVPAAVSPRLPAVTAIVIGVLRLYKLSISPLLGQRCRFAPSCSQYAQVAIGRYGVRSGIALALRRLARCHPWQPGGWDPVP